MREKEKMNRTEKEKEEKESMCCPREKLERMLRQAECRRISVLSSRKPSIDSRSRARLIRDVAVRNNRTSTKGLNLERRLVFEFFGKMMNIVEKSESNTAVSRLLRRLRDKLVSTPALGLASFETDEELEGQAQGVAAECEAAVLGMEAALEISNQEVEERVTTKRIMADVASAVGACQLELTDPEEEEEVNEAVGAAAAAVAGMDVKLETDPVDHPEALTVGLPAEIACNAFKGKQEAATFADEEVEKAAHTKTAEVYAKIADDHGLDLGQMALAWAMTRPFMGSVIFGATSLPQLESAIASADLTLSDEVMAGIDAAHKAHPMPY